MISKTMIRFISGAFLCSLLTACYVIPAQPGTRITQSSGSNAQAAAGGGYTLNARLYPTSQTAKRYGMVNATVSVNQSQYGVFSALIGGEQFTGEATRSASSPRQGKANGSSASGSYINCDYEMNSPQLGTGKCVMSDGATFDMHITR